MTRTIRTTLLISLLISLLLAACAPQAPATTEAVQETALETTAVEPTASPEPSATPEPTAEPTAEPIVLTDALGRELTLTAPAQRIVSLAPSNTESLFAVGAGSQVVARDEFSDYPAEVVDLPTIGGSFTSYNYEAIVALEPDLVLAAEINTPEQVKALEDLGLTVFMVPNPVTLEDLYTSLETFGKLTGRSEQATALATSLASRVVAVAEKVATVENKPVVFYEIDASDPNAPWTAGPGTFIDTLITLAGGQNVAADIDNPYPQISIEELLVRNPDVILLGDAAYGVTPEAVAQRTGWESLSAVQNNQVFPFDDNLVSRPGPRLVDGLEALVALLHPDL